MLGLRAGVDSLPNGDAVTTKAMRSLDRPQRPGLALSTISNLEFQYIDGPAGRFKVPTGHVNVDLDRINHVASRIVAGLFYTTFGHALPKGIEASAYELSGFGVLAMNWPDELLKLLQWIDSGWVEIGGTVFRHRCKGTEWPGVTFWELEFHRTTRFLGFTAPIEIDGPGKGASSHLLTLR